MQTLKTNKYLTIGYLLILGIVLGASIYAGAVVAPVTFHSEQWLGSEMLSRFQEGLIMTENFVRLGYFIIAGTLAIILYEGYQYKRFNRDMTKTLSSLGAIMSGMLFKYFYMSSILEMQAQGEKVLQSKIFENMHKGSEIALTLFMIFVIILFVRTLQKELK
jgi:hypothetical protein